MKQLKASLQRHHRAGCWELDKHFN